MQKVAALLQKSDLDAFAEQKYIGEKIDTLRNIRKNVDVKSNTYMLKQ